MFGDEQSWNMRLMNSYLSTLAKLRHMSLGAMARSTLVHRCLARGTCGQWITGLRGGIRHSGDGLRSLATA